jgi:hypothetical protein
MKTFFKLFSLMTIVGTILGGSMISNAVSSNEISTTLKPKTSNKTDQIVLTYNKKENIMNYNLNVTVDKSCQKTRIDIEPINAFTPPQQGIPLYEVNVKISNIKNRVCSKKFGEVKLKGVIPTYLEENQIRDFNSLFNLTWLTPSSKPSLIDELSKLKFIENTNDTYTEGNYKYTIKGVLLPHRTKDLSNCIGYRIGMGGIYCKSVVKTNKFDTSEKQDIKTAKDLHLSLGNINSVRELNFVSDALRGGGWDKGSIQYNGDFFTKNQNECTIMMNYYKVSTNNQKGYNFERIGSKIDKNAPAMCE